MTTDPTNEHLATIQAFFDAYAADDRDAISAVLAADIEWLLPGHHPLAGVKYGIDEVLAFFGALQGRLQGRDLLPAGER